MTHQKSPLGITIATAKLHSFLQALGVPNWQREKIAKFIFNQPKGEMSMETGECILCKTNKRPITSDDFCNNCIDLSETMGQEKFEEMLDKKGFYYTDMGQCWELKEDRDPREVNGNGEIIC